MTLQVPLSVVGYDVCAFSMFDSHVSAFTFGWNGGWPCIDGARQYGGRPLGLPPRRPFLSWTQSAPDRAVVVCWGIFKSITPGHHLS